MKDAAEAAAAGNRGRPETVLIEPPGPLGRSMKSSPYHEARDERDLRGEFAGWIALD